MGLKFLGLFAKNKAEATGEALVNALVGFDPETAADAEIEALEIDLSKDIELEVEFKTILEKEIAEFETAQAAVIDGEALLESLKADHDLAKTAKAKAAVVGTAQAVRGELDELREALVREESDVAPAEERHAQIREIVENKQEMLKQAYRVRDRSVADLKGAQRQKKLAQEQAKMDDRLSKARSKGGTNTALSRLQAAAADAEKETEVIRKKSSALSEARGGGQSAIAKLQAQRASSAKEEAVADPWAA